MITRHPMPDLVARLPLAGHAIIEASAGTGKTFTIEHLVVDLLLRHHASLDEILVVTFTVRATHELKIRIRRTLEEMLAGTTHLDDPDRPAWALDATARRHLAQALARFDTAAIHTIHAFCQRVLIDHAFASGRPLEQSVVDGRLAFGRAFRHALRHRIAADPALAPLLSHWLDARLVDELEQVLFDYHKQQGEVRPRLEPSRLEQLAQAITHAKDALAAASPAAIVAAFAHAPIHPLERDQVSATLAVVFRTLQRFPAERWGDIVANLDGVDLNFVVEPPTPWNFVPERPFAETLLPAVRDFVLAVAALQRALFPLDAAAVQWFLPVVREALADLKRREGWLDHDDMLLAVLDALRGSRGGQLAASLRERFRFALIDEFQDTDLVQWEVFRRLFVDADPGDAGSHRLFIIGDPKQAIYSFRGGDVATYLTARDRLSSAGAAPLRLDANYRSTARMVDAVNDLFGEAHGTPFFTGDIRYGEPVRCARPTLRLVDADGAEVAPVRLLHVTGEKLKAGVLRRRIGRAIAAEIRALLGDEQPLRFEEDGHPPQRVKAREIFVLARSNREANEIAGHLREAGVAYAFFKRDGLFQTPEAQDVRDLLAAVAHPDREALRLRAWRTPFFGIPVRELAACRALPDSHPLNARLHTWHALARNHDYERLFAAITNESGLVRRELFFGDSERGLTNTLHIFEVLLDVVARGRPSPDELLAQLSAFIDGRREPPGADGNVQRLESERAAVQIMTIHKAKGLEAAVVFVYGGFTRQQEKPPFVYHLPERPDGADEAPPTVRRIISLETPRDVPGQVALEREASEEHQRLLYVAVTRARGRVVLPYYDLESLGTHSRPYFLGSAYALLRDRLHSARERGADWFDVATVTPDIDKRRPGPTTPDPTLVWHPQPALLDETPVWQPSEGLRRRHLVVTSYSRMKARAAARTPVELAEVVREGTGRGVVLPPDAVPGGPAAGSFVHDVLERVRPEHVRSALRARQPLARWRKEPHVVSVIDDALRRLAMPQACRADAERMVFAALATPFRVAGVEVPCIAAADAHAHELEFFFPLPNAGAEPESSVATGRTLRVERGWVKGYIDLLFEHQGRIIFVDWKTDVLPSYDDHTLRVHVTEHYGWQARLYVLACVKMLRIHDEPTYEARFGGYAYTFVRGMEPSDTSGRSVFTGRPSWDEVLSFEAELARHPIL